MISTADAFAVAQALLGVRVLGRMIATRDGVRIAPDRESSAPSSTIAAIVPVLDERERVGACLAGLLAAPASVGQILVVDGGSTDGTPELVRGFAARDARITLVDASPVPAGWNGKAWNLACGLAATDPRATWILMLDADVRPQPQLAPALLAHATWLGLDALSAAPLLELSGAAEALLHPAFLATLVYRFGLPGHVARRPRDVQANGQCFFARRELLVRTGAIAAARASRCEDVTIARHLVHAGAALGFYEGAQLASVRMYASAAECWTNWPRSLPLRDATTTRIETALALLEVLLVQGLPLALLFAAVATRVTTRSFFFRVNVALALARLGVLAGTRRAYASVPVTYWLAACADLPVALRLVQATFAKHHVWRGRTLVPERGAA